ncbi:MAG: hypothetical protein IPK81_08240 [Rhodospirillales bacterium]|nr:MAG: hypothetical protein IPK81_08240 [Rhodospirillales bacterium]
MKTDRPSSKVDIGQMKGCWIPFPRRSLAIKPAIFTVFSCSLHLALSMALGVGAVGQELPMQSPQAHILTGIAPEKWETQFRMELPLWESARNTVPSTAVFLAHVFKFHKERHPDKPSSLCLNHQKILASQFERIEEFDGEPVRDIFSPQVTAAQQSCLPNFFGTMRNSPPELLDGESKEAITTTTWGNVLYRLSSAGDSRRRANQYIAYLGDRICAFDVATESFGDCDESYAVGWIMDRDSCKIDEFYLPSLSRSTNRAPVIPNRIDHDRHLSHRTIFRLGGQLYAVGITGRAADENAERAAEKLIDGSAKAGLFENIHVTLLIIGEASTGLNTTGIVQTCQFLY